MYCSYKKNTIMPDTAIKAPITSFKVNFSFIIICEGKSMNTGTVAIKVDAIPKEVYLNATIPNDTPRKGPKKEPITNALLAFLSVNPLGILPHFFKIEISIAKPIIPVITRI